MGHLLRIVPPASAIGLALTLTSCEFVSNAMKKSPEERLAAAALQAWASPGQPLAAGAFGSVPVDSVVPGTEPRTWKVLTTDARAPGGHRRWEMELLRTDVLPVVPGEAFARWVNARAREIDRRLALSSDAFRLLSGGTLFAVGDVEAQFRRLDQSAANHLKRTAYLQPAEDGGDPIWRLQPEVRTAAILREALLRVYYEFARTDERVMTCMGADAQSVDRATQLKCIAEVLGREFGQP